MTPEADKRDFVSKLYPSYGWRKKVAAMSDAQVYAIWLKEQRKAEAAKKQKKAKDDHDDIPF